MQFTPIYPDNTANSLTGVLKTYEGFKKISSFIESGFKIVEAKQGLPKKVSAVALSIIATLSVFLIALPLTLHLTFKVIKSDQFKHDSIIDKSLSKFGAITMLPGVAVTFVLFSIRELIKKTAELVKEDSHHEHVYQPFNPEEGAKAADPSQNTESDPAN